MFGVKIREKVWNWSAYETRLSTTFCKNKTIVTVEKIKLKQGYLGMNA